jgi:hypothetical protein
MNGAPSAMSQPMMVPTGIINSSTSVNSIQIVEIFVHQRDWVDVAINLIMEVFQVDR